MCGIVGFLGDFSEPLLAQMNQAVAHRGPDDQGFFYDPTHHIGLGHRRLSIIDLSPLGHQPMWDVQQRVVIVYNGELYNYPELKKELLKQGFPFRSQCDTEVLLNLYLRDGFDMLSQLNGIFAFALWDPHKQHLFLARDGQGIKPLYYTQTPQGLLFASELKSLLQCPQVDRTLDIESIHHHLTYQWAPAPHTLLKSIHKLEPGHAMVAKHQTPLKKWRFYDLPYQQPIASLSVSQATEELQMHLQRAVQRQLLADVPVGAFLSGGLDSSAVVAFAQKVAPDPTRNCFTIGFKGNANPPGEGREDDLPYAKRAAQHLQTQLHTVWVGPEMFEEVERMVYHLDEPQADFAPIHVYFICKLAREHGIKVLLSGAGGDDLFTGYRRHTALMFEQAWSWMPTQARTWLQAISQQLPSANTLGRRVAKAFQYAHLQGDQRIASYFHCLPPQHIQQLYTPDIARKLQTLPFSAPLMETLRQLPQDTHPLNRMLYLEGKHFLPDHNLNYTDKMSMATGVEVRVPLLDPDLISFAARLPVQFKQHYTTGKWIFKKAMEPFLPKDIIYRPKTGFGVPMRQWLRQELRPLVEQTLSSQTIKKRGIFEPEAIKQLLQQNQNGQIDGAYLVFALVVLEIWMRLFLDTPAPQL